MGRSLGDRARSRQLHPEPGPFFLQQLSPGPDTGDSWGGASRFQLCFLVQRGNSSMQVSHQPYKLKVSMRWVGRWGSGGSERKPRQVRAGTLSRGTGFGFSHISFALDQEANSHMLCTERGLGAISKTELRGPPYSPSAGLLS